jgi:hypothetical protein
MITGSALPRLLNCAASEVLAHAENASEWADAGNEDHAELAHMTLTGTRVEVKLAYDTATREGRFLGEASDRSYGKPAPFEIFMSTDVVGVDGDAVVILDWKTGGDVEPAATNGQLWACALAACRALGKHQAIIRIVYTRTNRCDEHAIDALELAEFAGRLERLHVHVTELKAAKSRGEALPTREGTWCKYCPAKHACPSKNALIVQVAEKGLAVLGDAAMTPERARAGYEQLVRIEDLIRDARKRLETYVDEQGPIDLGDGRMFGRYVRAGNEKLSGDTAIVAIADVLGDTDAAKRFELHAIERKTSKAAIDRAVKEVKAPRGTATKIVKRIRELGGASHAPDTMPIGEYARDRDEPAEKPAIDVDAINAQLQEAG